MLIAQTISPYKAINNTLDYSKTYDNNNYTVITDDQYEYQKVRIANSLAYDNEVVKIESTVSYKYYHDRQGQEQSLFCFNVVKLTPKVDLNSYRVTANSIYSQAKLPYTTGSKISAYAVENMSNYGTYINAFLNMTSYNNTVVNSLNTYVCVNQNLQEETSQTANNNILNNFGNWDVNPQLPRTDPIVIIFKLYYINDYGTQGTEQWNDATTFLYGQPTYLNGTYSWTVQDSDIHYTEIVDIPGLLLTILGMPFAFVSQAFDLTVFPGTPYAVNLSHIFLAIIAAGILIFIIKKVLK